MHTIAKIKLAAGHVGWYEPLSRIHLTLSNPIAEITAGTKLEGIRTSLSYGTIVLIEGSIEENEVIETVNEQVQLAETEEAAKFSIEPQEVQQEQETVEEEKPKKATKKKAKLDA